MMAVLQKPTAITAISFQLHPMRPPRGHTHTHTRTHTHTDHLCPQQALVRAKLARAGSPGSCFLLQLLDAVGEVSRSGSSLEGAGSGRGKEGREALTEGGDRYQMDVSKREEGIRWSKSCNSMFTAQQGG
jgi:hypothetical protein